MCRLSHGIDSIYDWCREHLEGADGAEDELYCDIMCVIDDYRHPERATARTAMPVDREALMELEKELDGMAPGYVIDRRGFAEVARRIREAREGRRE